MEGRDLAVTKISINMGKTSTDSLGRSNPVEKMLFYHKGNLQATKSEILHYVDTTGLRDGERRADAVRSSENPYRAAVCCGE